MVEEQQMDKTIEDDFKHYDLTPEQVSRIKGIKHLAKALSYELSLKCPNSTESYAANKKLQEAVMWAVASIEREKSEGA